MATVAQILGLTAAFKFQPADEEVVEFYLLPRLRGQPLPLNGVIIDDDPRSTLPWKLFERNGRQDNVDHTFFVAPADSGKGNVRTCAGGTWVGMKIDSKGELHLGGETFAWEVYRLNYHWGVGRNGSTGWVMLEYSIKAPADYASVKVCKISFTGNGQKRKRVPDGFVDDGDTTTLQHAAALPASTTRSYFSHQEQDAEQDAGAGGETGPWSWAYEEPLATTTTTAQQDDDQEILPLLDDVGGLASPGGLVSSSAATAIDDGMIQSHVYNDALVEGEADSTWTYQEPYTATKRQRLDDQDRQPQADTCGLGLPGFSSTSTTSAMDDGMMPLMGQEDRMPALSVESGMPCEQFFEIDDLELRVLLESFGDFATAAPGFGDYGLHHHVLPEHSVDGHPSLLEI